MLYENEKGLTILQMADMLKEFNIPPPMISATIAGLTQRGISFQSERVGRFYVFRLDRELREKQAKEDFIKF